jgi:signal peptidase I
MAVAPKMPRPTVARRPPEPQAPVKPRDRSWSTRLAWIVLCGGGLLVVARMSLATVVKIHGDGMAPTLVDGDHVLLVRGEWSVERGDVIVYATDLPEAPDPVHELPAEGDAPRTKNTNGHEFPDARAQPGRDLRNTAVVDPDELGDALESNWRTVQARADGSITERSYRVGRVLARPGDRIVVVRRATGVELTIDGATILRKPAPPLRILLRDAGHDASERAAAYETNGERRYLVLDRGAVALDLRALGLARGETETVAPGYLVLADNRDEGACCDSRALGWIDAARIRGEITARLAGDPAATPDLDPAARGFVWKP